MNIKKILLKKIIFVTVIINLFFILSPHQTFPLDVKRKVLDNGLILLISERHNLPVVKVSLGINAGNLMEPAEKAGLSSLVASLLTDGTTSRTAEQISESIEFVGGSIGASGGGDYNSASLSVLKKDIALGFELLSDIILHPVFPEDEFEKKKQRVKGSLRAREEDPDFLASREFTKTLFGDHPYGRLISGTAETIDNIKREDLVEFHSTYYVPENSVMSVVGDIEPEEVEKLLDTYFSKWDTKKSMNTSLPHLEANRKKQTIKIDKDLTQATVRLGHVGVSRDNPDYYAISVMNYILGGGGFASRLMQNVREEKGLVYDISSYFNADRLGGSFQLTFQTKNESANVAIEEVLEEIKKIRNNPVTDRELADAKAFLTGSFPMRIETSSRIANFLVAVEFYDLGVGYIDDYPVFINNVSKDDVLRVAKKYLDPEQFILVVVANQDKAGLKDRFK
jgi:zinc protease